MTLNHHQTLKQELVQIITVQKNIAPSRLLGQSFDQIGMDQVDLVAIILEIERAYQVNIPDDVPLNKVDDFVAYLSACDLRFV